MLFGVCNTAFSGKTHENSPKFGYFDLIRDPIFPRNQSQGYIPNKASIT